MGDHAVTPERGVSAMDGRSTRQQLPRVAVLVIDDEWATRDMLEALLTLNGYSVRTAANGREALDLLRTVRPSLILLDVQMPVMDGAEFRQCQRRDRSLLEIPTVVMTGAAVEPMLDLAVAKTLRKPARGSELLALVQRYCDG